MKIRKLNGLWYSASLSGEETLLNESAQEEIEACLGLKDEGKEYEFLSERLVEPEFIILRDSRTEEENV